MPHSTSQMMGMEIVGNECDADGALSDGMMGALRSGGGARAPTDAVAHVVADSCHTVAATPRPVLEGALLLKLF